MQAVEVYFFDISFTIVLWQIGSMTEHLKGQFI